MEGVEHKWARLDKPREGKSKKQITESKYSGNKIFCVNLNHSSKERASEGLKFNRIIAESKSSGVLVTYSESSTDRRVRE